MVVEATELERQTLLLTQLTSQKELGLLIDAKEKQLEVLDRKPKATLTVRQEARMVRLSAELDDLDNEATQLHELRQAELRRPVGGRPPVEPTPQMPGAKPLSPPPSWHTFMALPSMAGDKGWEEANDSEDEDSGSEEGGESEDEGEVDDFSEEPV